MHKHYRAAKLVSFNCRSVKKAYLHVRDFCQDSDIIALQEHWLFQEDIDYLKSIHPDFDYHGVSAIDAEKGTLMGRPYGGVAVMWRRSLFPCVVPVDSGSTRIAAVRIQLADRSVLVMSVYMPSEDYDNLTLFSECLAKISAIIEESDIECVISLGDYNAKPSGLFYRELCDYCSEQD
ncbi:hypothetical protein O0L34_g19305 [Tuta absoluta]|nr:hypothetical protein O0L34_g19305 [Tuta absoluta]